MLASAPLTQEHTHTRDRRGVICGDCSEDVHGLPWPHTSCELRPCTLHTVRREHKVRCGCVCSCWSVAPLSRCEMWTHPCRRPRGCRCSACTRHTLVSSGSSSPRRRGSPLWRAADTQGSPIRSVPQHEIGDVVELVKQ